MTKQIIISSNFLIFHSATLLSLPYIHMILVLPFLWEEKLEKFDASIWIYTEHLKEGKMVVPRGVVGYNIYFEILLQSKAYVLVLSAEFLYSPKL